MQIMLIFFFINTVDLQLYMQSLADGKSKTICKAEVIEFVQMVFAACKCLI